jgi:hypothetical protein
MDVEGGEGIDKNDYCTNKSHSECGLPSQSKSESKTHIIRTV